MERGTDSPIIPQASLEKLARLLHRHAGLRIGRDSFYSLRFALLERLTVLGLKDAAGYVERLEAAEGVEELRALLPLVTVGYTSFFRDPRQFEALTRTLLPSALVDARQRGRPLSILSAGCATGEEPYSVAMVLRELDAKPHEVNLLAVDVNGQALRRAREGRYSARQVEAVGRERIARHFRPTADGYEVHPELKTYVRFSTANLSTAQLEPQSPSGFDLVLCRNVIIYFDLAVTRRLMDAFHDALVPGGHLLLGYSESLFSVYDRFELVEVDGAFLYRRPAAPSRGSPVSEAVSPTMKRAPARPPPSGPARSSGGAASQGRGLHSAPASSASGPAASLGRQRLPPTASGPTGGAQALASIGLALEEGRFDAAVSALLALAAERSGELPVLLSLGNVYCLLGRSADAREIFRQVLEAEPLCVEAQIYWALVDLQDGAFDEAAERLRRARFLEPGCAITYHLTGQVHERQADLESAARAYRDAIAAAARPQRDLAGLCPELPTSGPLVERAARYALQALEAARVMQGTTLRVPGPPASPTDPGSSKT